MREISVDMMNCFCGYKITEKEMDSENAYETTRFKCRVCKRSVAGRGQVEATKIWNIVMKGLL